MTVLLHDFPAKCDPSRVWALLSDLEAVARYNPGVRQAAVRGEKAQGVGAERRCELTPKGRVIERVTHWEEGKAVGLEVIESDWPIHFMRWVTRVEPDGTGARVRQRLEYRVRFGPLGWVLDRLVMRRKLGKALDEVLQSLITHAERGPQR